MDSKYFCILSLFFILSCNTTTKEVTNTPITIDLVRNFEEAQPQRKIKDFFDIETVIKLESNDNSFISSVGKFFSIKDSIFILDDKYSGIKVFNKNGNYLNTIGTVGQGPGEFTKIFDINYDKVNDNLLVYSNDDMKISTFKKSGKLLNEQRVPFFAYYFTPIEDDNFLFYANYNTSEFNEKNNLIQTDSKFKVKNLFFPYKRNFALSMSGFLTKTSIGVLYSDALTDEVYEYSDKKMQLKYKFNFGKYLMDPKLTDDQLSVVKNLLNYSCISKVSAETSGLLFFSIYHLTGKSNGFLVKDKNTIYTKLDFHNDDLFHLLSPFSSISDNDKKFIAYINAETVRYTTNENKNMLLSLKTNYPGVYKEISNLKDTDNPIMIVFKLK